MCFWSTEPLSECFLAVSLSSLHSPLNTKDKSWPAQSQWPLGCCELSAEKAIFCLNVELVAQGCHNKPELLHEERHFSAAAKLRQRFVAAKSLLCMPWLISCIFLVSLCCAFYMSLEENVLACFPLLAVPQQPFGILICKTNWWWTWRPEFFQPI